MAIIYETQTDLERDKLKEQSKDMYLKSVSQSGTGLASFVVSSFIERLNRNDSKALHVAGWVATIFGGVKIVQSLFTASKAHSLALEKERLGPQNVIYPPDVGVSETAGEKANCGCKKNGFSDIKPTSLLQQAEKRLSELGRE